MPTQPISILKPSGETDSGTITYQEFPQAEIRSRAIRKTCKIYGLVLGIGLAGLLIPLVHFAVAPLLVLSVLTLPITFSKFLGDKATFSEVQGTCPYCHQATRLTPFVDHRFRETITVQCSLCGETTKARMTSSS